MIMAHNEWELLQKLISLLDDERNDIFVHIDKKVNSWPKLKVEKSVLRFVPDVKRVDIRWGTESQVKADLTLLEYALSYGSYSYYHLLSGVDLPIKSNNYIHNFFNENNGKEFIGFVPFDKHNKWEKRLRYWHFFLPLTREHNLKKYIPQILHDTLLIIQKVLCIHRSCDVEIKKGEVWVSITQQFATYVIGLKECIFKRISHTYCVDELLWQTLIWNSPFRNDIYTIKSEGNGCMREIDWAKGTPYIWGQYEGDFNTLMHSNKIFARKFSSQYPSVVEKIYNEIKHLNE